MIVADVETSGISPSRNSILSIGALDFNNHKNQFYGECRVWDGAEISSEALAINEFSQEEALDPDKQTLEELAHKFFVWTQECPEKTLAGQNVSFDRDFLNDSFRRAKIDYRFAVRSVDLHSVCYADFLIHGTEPPLKNDHTDLDLDAIANYVGMPSEPKPHNALNGAKYEAEAFNRLLYGKNLLEEFAEYPVVKAMQKLPKV